MTGGEAVARILVNEDRCIGAGQCVRWAPAQFDQDEQTGIVRLLAQPDGRAAPGVEGAVRACPSGAIGWAV